jgi:hypothetical protein
MISERWWLVALSLALVGCVAGCGSDAPGTPAVTSRSTSAIALSSEIAGTSTTCGQFAARTVPVLGQVHYSVKGSSISAVDPGAFDYWVKVAPSKSGLETVTITQSSDPVSRPLFTTNGGVFDKFSAGARTCQAITATIGQVNPVNVTFIASAGTTYYVDVKFSVAALVQQPAPSGGSIKLVFSTTGVKGSTSEIDVVKT